MRASRAAPAGWGLKCARDAGPRRWPATRARDERPPARRGGSKQSGGIYSGAGLCEGDASHGARSPSGGLDGAAWELPSFCCGREWCMVSRKRRTRQRRKTAACRDSSSRSAAALSHAAGSGRREHADACWTLRVVPHARRTGERSCRAHSLSGPMSLAKSGFAFIVCCSGGFHPSQ